MWHRSSRGLWLLPAQGLVAGSHGHTHVHTCARWITCTRRIPAPQGPGSTHMFVSAGSLAGHPLSSVGRGVLRPSFPSRRGSQGQQGIRGPTHFIFSARCSVFSRMAWDNWDTGFSIRLSKITCEDQASAQCPGVPRKLLPQHTRHRAGPVS